MFRTFDKESIFKAFQYGTHITIVIQTLKIMCTPDCLLLSLTTKLIRHNVSPAMMVIYIFKSSFVNLKYKIYKKSSARLIAFNFFLLPGVLLSINGV
jgi:hypothetical protein